MITERRKGRPARLWREGLASGQAGRRPLGLDPKEGYSGVESMIRRAIPKEKPARASAARSFCRCSCRSCLHAGGFYGLRLEDVNGSWVCLQGRWAEDLVPSPGRGPPINPALHPTARSFDELRP